ncbi:S8 family serine peptidase [Rubricoccus marinus]|uniref:Peptidase S8/S53 domain-containing protein n=1 Tax=Rubricoccus marinus TaxID=716817 RepID=A0A259U3E1_9BACT|nr:S8 family serine peptidase [Rubricoccus marinus]OZC04367.1 hypothetical protein BSZ36_16100 [Rubricoccus marinus]
MSPLRLACALALFSLVGVSASAQEAARYWIVVGETVAAPAPSPEAAARRALRGTAAPSDRTLAPEARAELLAHGVVPLVESRWLGAVSAALTAEQRAAVAALPFVREVRPVGRFVPAEADRAPLAEPLAFVSMTAPLAPWGAMPKAGPSLAQLASVGADRLLDAGYDGTGVTVGFLDTLYDFDHPALTHIGVSGRLAGVEDFTGPRQQSSFHGLAVSSITLGGAEGMLLGPARGARVLAATTEYAPTETHAEEDNFVAGLEWLEAQGVDVVNISLGYSTFDAGEGDFTYADMDGNTTLVTRAADAAASRGVVIVTSAGNEGNSAWQYITAPADADSVITVGATRPGGIRATFSSTGPTADGRIKPDVMAQGTNMVTATRGGAYSTTGQGTSYSAPLVTGVVAQLLQARPSLTPIQVREALRSTASQASAPDNLMGWGVVNGPAALAVATALETPPESLWRVGPSPVRAGSPLTVDTPEPLALAVLDVLGRRVAEIPAGARGRQTVLAPDLPSGLYFVWPEGGALPAQRLVIVR